MVRKVQPFLWLFLLMIATASFAAETTGTLSGVVRGADGAGLASVPVTVKGTFLPAGRTVVTDKEGAFSFQRLVPGTYQVSADVQGMGGVQREALVALDRDTQVELSLQPRVEGEITVTEAQPLIDVKSTAAQVNFTSEEIEDLPVPRTYKGLFELAPGVAENGRLAPTAGGSRMDNLFLLDGINITNPDYGDIFPDITQLDIKEVSVIRGGLSAEFGRTGGMVINAITKSGTNEFRGEARVEYQPSSFVAANKSATVQNTQDSDFVGIALGGPILRDRLWFYGSASRPSITTTDRRNNLGSVPDEELVTQEYFGKLTANPTANQFINAGLRSRDRTDKNAGIGSTANPSVGSDDSRKYLLGTATWTWNVTADSFVEAKYNHDKEENSTDPTLNLGYRPAFNALRPGPQRPVHLDLRLPRRRRHRGGAVGGRREPGGQQPGLHARRGAGDLPDLPDLGEHAPRPAGGVHLRGERRAAGAARQRLGHRHLERHHPAVHGELRLPAAAAHRPRHLLWRLRPGPDRPRRAADAHPRRARQPGRLLRRGERGDPRHQAEEEDPVVRLGPADPAAPRRRLRPQRARRRTSSTSTMAATTTPRTSRSGARAPRPASSPPARRSTPPAT